ncbi:chemotaxis protein CheB [Geminicoccus roseus]|uniref:chemotaxis protein CheB n=1 Tax=Geminicoccus roseus TaxID=404900 RepID=UPI0003FD4862|nr:chemotaxis protein CheB [Geminicoccus roseus]
MSQATTMASGAAPAKRCIAIGASGRSGLDDIRRLLAALPAPLPASVLAVLHRPVDEISHLQEILARATRLPVRIAREGEKLQPGRVYVGEPAWHLTMLEGGMAGMVAGEDNQYRNRTVDILFRSVAEHCGQGAIGVVLSGSLDDGARGLAAIRAAHGTTMVLTPERDQPPGMPENAIDHDGPINVIGSPAFIAAEIARLLAPA